MDYHSLFSPVYMDENCRQYAGMNPLCTRLHDDSAKCRLEMQKVNILQKMSSFSAPFHGHFEVDSNLGSEEGGRLKATRGLLATDHVILNHGQVTWTTPELAPPPLLTTTPHQREDVSALDRFNVHRCPTRRVFSGTGIELVTRQATIRYLYHSATAATPHSGQCSNNSRCINCKGDHPANSLNYPEYIKEKKILELKCEQHLTLGEARRRFRDNNRTSYSAVIQTNTVNLDMQDYLEKKLENMLTSFQAILEKQTTLIMEAFQKTMESVLSHLSKIFEMGKSSHSHCGKKKSCWY
ncbi:uncharacterized protein TNCV_2384401 [Trichonephila clavipes]|nr:uncharacterized protein TNCV_2384401 [Trichonephila clavipes]